MIKAEVISEDNGYEVPNWLTKCKDALTSPRTLGTFAVLLFVAFGVSFWHYHRNTALVNEGGIQSHPATTSSLQVIPSSFEQTATQAKASTSTAAVGPAPTTSLTSLQPTGSSQHPSSLNQALNQTVQSAGNASTTMSGNL